MENCASNAKIKIGVGLELSSNFNKIIFDSSLWYFNKTFVFRQKQE